MLERRQPGLGIRLVARYHLVAAHDTILRFIQAHQSAKLVGLVGLAFADHAGMRLEQTQDFLYRLFAQHHPVLSLTDDFLRQRQEVLQLRQLGEHRQLAAYHGEASLLEPLQDLLRLLRIPMM